MKPGDTVGSYQLVRELGAGGQGTVWEARRGGAAERFAVKITEVTTPAHRERAQREADLLVAIHDPGIPRFVEVVHSATAVAVVMELVDGIPLGAALQARSVTVSERRAILMDLARALSALHERGIVHRDVKPANVLLRPGWERGVAGCVVLVDLGIAKFGPARTGLTKQGIVLGTGPFVAPELLASGQGSAEATAASDVFSWGVLAWLLLFGGHPTGLSLDARTTDFMVAYAQSDQHWLRPPAAEAVARGVADAALVTTAVRALREHPSQRPQNGSQLMSSLSQWGPPTNIGVRPGDVDYTRLALTGQAPAGVPLATPGPYTQLELSGGATTSTNAASVQQVMVPATQHGSLHSSGPRSQAGSSSALVVGVVTGLVALVVVGALILVVAVVSRSDDSAPSPAAATSGSPPPTTTEPPPSLPTVPTIDPQEEAARRAQALEKAKREAPSRVTVHAERCYCAAGHEIIVQCRVTSTATVPVSVNLSASGKTGIWGVGSHGISTVTISPGASVVQNVATHYDGLTNCSSADACSCAKVSALAP